MGDPSHAQSADDSRLDKGACFAVKDIGKPCAGKPQARFDEGGLASQLWCGYLGTGRRKRRKQISQPKVDHASSLLYPVMGHVCDPSAVT